MEPKRSVPFVADATLVRRALDGDPGPAMVIVKRYLPLVRRILRASGNGPDVEDTTQEVFARCFECLPRLREPASLRSFIFGIALRLAAAERRRRRRRWRERLTPTGELPEPCSARNDMDPREVVIRTREILGRLRPEASLALNLRFVQEKELSEVAANMGVSLATAKRHLARASARVRAMAHGEPAVAEYIRDARARGGSAIRP